MRIGILGAGLMGVTLARKLAASGHEVCFANSRGPETILHLEAETGARAVAASQAVQDADAVILSLPLGQLAKIRPLLKDTPADVPVIDTSNYYPHRDGRIAALDDGAVESLWVQEQINRPVIRAWNAVLAGTFKEKGLPKGDPNRTAIPISGNDAGAKQVAMSLVDLTGFDPVDAGSIEDSWRIQAGNPAYCAELTASQLAEAIMLADRSKAAVRRDAYVAAIFAFAGDFNSLQMNDDIVRLNHAITQFPRAALGSR